MNEKQKTQRNNGNYIVYIHLLQQYTNICYISTISGMWNIEISLQFFASLFCLFANMRVLFETVQSSFNIEKKNIEIFIIMVFFIFYHFAFSHNEEKKKQNKQRTNYVNLEKRFQFVCDIQNEEFQRNTINISTC